MTLISYFFTCSKLSQFKKLHSNLSFSSPWALQYDSWVLSNRLIPNDTDSLHELLNGYIFFCFLQLTSLSKTLRHEKAPALRNFTVIPLLVTPEKDEALLKLTEGRISTFEHDLVPIYLRTKPDPEAEQKMAAFQEKVAHLTRDACNVSSFV